MHRQFQCELASSANAEPVYRRTGVELKDTGIRDENGIEPIPSFSSPAKSGLQPKGITHDATYSADDSMDIDQSKALPKLYLFVDRLLRILSRRYITGAYRRFEKRSQRQD